MVKLLAVEGAAALHRFAFLARERGPSAATPPARASSVVLTTRTATVYGEPHRCSSGTARARAC